MTLFLLMLLYSFFTKNKSKNERRIHAVHDDSRRAIDGRRRDQQSIEKQVSEV